MGLHWLKISFSKHLVKNEWLAIRLCYCIFTGARLVDVIKAMGYTDEDLAKHKYVQFEGLDIDPSGVPYGSSIATEKAMDLNHCVMVAYEMNGRCESQASLKTGCPGCRAYPYYCQEQADSRPLLSRTEMVA